MALIGYELIVLGIGCLVSKAEWLVSLKKYLMLLFIGIGCALISVDLLDDDRTLIIFPGFFVILCFSLLIWVIFNRKKQREEIIHIPAGSYTIQTVDRTGSPVVQLSYLLFYDGKVYHLSTFPPDGNPSLILHAHIRKDSDVILADIAIDQSNEPLSIRQKMQQLRNFLTFLAALFLPISYMMYENHTISENLMPACMLIILGRSSIGTTKGSKALLHRLIYCFGVFFEGAGWFSFIFLTIKSFVL